jgi:hypothetical protein
VSYREQYEADRRAALLLLCADCGKERVACRCATFVQRLPGDEVCQNFLGIASGGAQRYCAHIGRRHNAAGRCLVPGCRCETLRTVAEVRAAHAAEKN